MHAYIHNNNNTHIHNIHAYIHNNTFTTYTHTYIKHKHTHKNMIAANYFHPYLITHTIDPLYLLREKK